MSTLIQPPSPTDSDWEPSGRFDVVDLDALGDCLGYRVDDPNGRVGTVDGIVSGTWIDRPDTIEIRVGLPGQPSSRSRLTPSRAYIGRARGRSFATASTSPTPTFHEAAGHRNE